MLRNSVLFKKKWGHKEALVMFMLLGEWYKWLYHI